MSDRIRLTILTDTVADAGGAPAQAWRVARNCDPDIFDCTIVALFRDGHDTPVERSTVRQGGMGSTIPGYRLGLSRRFLRWNPLALSAVRRTVRRLRPHCVCAIGTESRILSSSIAKSGIGSVAAVDSVGFETESDSLPSLREANRRTRRFVTTSYAAAQRLVRQEGADRNRIDIIPNGIDCSEIPARTSESVIDAKHRMGLSLHQPVVLLASDFVRHKDHLTFLEAAAHLRPLVANARFVLIGQGGEAALAELDATIDRLFLTGRVTVINDWATLPLWTQAADVGVLTSYSESCSRTLLSYMAAGLPIVAVGAGGNPELIQHNKSGYLANPGDADQIAMYLMLLLLSQDMAEEFGEAARQRVETEFTAHQEARRWSDYLRTVAVTGA
jgi:glycosyltransferase involved in cell wall biosynthesis